MANINYHPAPGLGELLPGFFVVPQNPMVNDKVTYTPRIGDILPAKFPVPQNPIKDYMEGRIHQIAREPGQAGVLNGKGMGDCGCGGGCGGCGGGTGLGLVQDEIKVISDYVSAGQIGDAIQSPLFGIPLYGVLMGVVAVTMMLGSSSGGGNRVRR